MDILIIEDEKPNADRLKRLIHNLRPQANFIGVLESVADSVAWLSVNIHPDVIMMDVKLSDGVSFEIFDKVKVEAPIIFTTAYDEYAIKAFKQYSIDYLLKPIEKEELSEAFDKLDYISGVASPKSFEKLLDAFKPKEYRSRFLLPYRDSFKTVLINEVLFFYSELKITKAKLDNGKEEILPQTMDELELQVDPKLFFRANRQFIIHIDAIEQVHNYFNSKLKIVLKKNPNIEVVVSRDKAPILKTWMGY